MFIAKDADKMSQYKPDYGMVDGATFVACNEERLRLAALNAELLAALQDAEFLMRQAGKHAGPLQDSFNRSAEDARAAIAKAQP